MRVEPQNLFLLQKALGFFFLQLLLYCKRLEFNTNGMQNSNASKKEKNQEC